MAGAALAGCLGPSAAPVTVFAAASLRETVDEISIEWSKKTGRSVRLQFEASSTLARHILEGAGADLFLCADPEWLDQVPVVDRFDWLGNRLVLVGHRMAPTPVLERLESLALANERVPAGKYARLALAHLKVRLPDRVVYGANVRDVLSKVSQGGAEAGIVYATDAAVDPDVRTVFTFPPESHPRIVYSVGLLGPAGRAFFNALREPWAVAVGRRHGFAELD
ncbi:MAG: molybdate ABC transporter substrate-binding protein [Planctomycetes bacterium]|nr:molybdate ABC transporter substrate-binding protein [Planctomycetota bacterium]